MTRKPYKWTKFGLLKLMEQSILLSESVARALLKDSLALGWITAVARYANPFRFGKALNNAPRPFVRT